MTPKPLSKITVLVRLAQTRIASLHYGLVLARVESLVQLRSITLHGLLMDFTLLPSANNLSL